MASALRCTTAKRPRERAWTPRSSFDVVRKIDDAYARVTHYDVGLTGESQAPELAHRFASSMLSALFEVRVVCDAAGRIRSASKTLSEMTGIGRDALQRRPVHALFVADDQASIADLLRKSRDQDVGARELRLVGKNGLIPLAVSCASRRDRRNRFTGTVVVGRPAGELQRAYAALNDLHLELKRTQQQLVDSEKLAGMGRLVAGVAHELNNPIGFVHANVHMLRKYGERIGTYMRAVRARDSPAKLEAVRKALRVERLLADLDPLIEETLEGTERIRDIVGDLKRYITQEPGKREPIRLRHMLSNAVHWVTKGANKPLELVLDVDPEITAWGYEGQLHRVSVNLALNALDAMEKTAKPRLEISAATREDAIVISFRDNGTGVPEQDVEKIFAPFYTTKPGGKGTGLGLAISNAIVRDHDGRITVQNSPHGGAVFSVVLPASRVIAAL